MSDDDSADDGLLIGRILIERRLYSSGRDLVTAVADKGDGNTDDGLEAVTALGMLRLAEGLVIDSSQEGDIT